MTKKERLFVKKVWDFYHRHGRQSLPWRKTKNPYHILVSEIMLQQTQVERVIPKYESFLKKFPTVKDLAKARLGDVLREWQGLGYNRRAKMLHHAAKEIEGTSFGTFPRTSLELQKLSGVGPYTAGAVMAFAYNKPVPVIETNIRSVYLHHFFKNKESVTDTEILGFVERTMDTENPREWYAALMDYGSHLKKEKGSKNVQSKHYTKQSTFKGSDREIRGAILRALSGKGYSEKTLYADLTFTNKRVKEQLKALLKEGLIKKNGQLYTLP